MCSYAFNLGQATVLLVVAFVRSCISFHASTLLPALCAYIMLVTSTMFSIKLCRIMFFMSDLRKAKV